MAFLTVWTADLLEPVLRVASRVPLNPVLALSVRDLEALSPEPIVAALRARRAEVATRGYLPLPAQAPAPAWRANLSLGQQLLWKALGRMPTAAFGVPYPSLLLEAHLDVALLPGQRRGVYLLRDELAVHALEVSPDWPSEPTPLAGVLGTPREGLEAWLEGWVERHGPGLLPSRLPAREPSRVVEAPRPPEAPPWDDPERWRELLERWAHAGT